MKIMVIGAYGHAGRLIINEGARRGHTMIGLAHQKHRLNLPAQRLIIKSIFDLDKTDLQGIDAIVDAIGAWSPMTETVHYNGLLHVIRLIRHTSVHYIKVGGANTLYINREHTRTLQELPLYYPDYMQDLCSAHAEGLKILRSFSDVDWTYATPTYNFDRNGRKTGHYVVEGEEFHPAHSKNPNNGKHDYISYADYAQAVIDIVEQHQFIRQRITLVSGNNPIPTQRY